MPKTKQEKCEKRLTVLLDRYEQKLNKLLQEYEENPATTLLDGIIAVIAELQIRVYTLEAQADMEERLAQEVAKETFGEVLKIYLNEFDWSEYKEQVCADRKRREASGEATDLKAGKPVVVLINKSKQRFYLSSAEWLKIEQQNRAQEEEERPGSAK